jgi:uncharacterized membrane protein YtjA (UPF0391 family)
VKIGPACGPHRRAGDAAILLRDGPGVSILPENRMICRRFRPARHRGKERFPPPGIDGGTRRQGGQAMLGLVVTLLVIALIAAVLGFGGIAGAAVGMAKIVFFVALVLFLISLVFGLSRGSLRW